MKKGYLFSTALIVLLGLTSASFPLLKIMGGYSMYAQSQAGWTGGIDFPLIPLFPTALYITKTNDVSIATNFSMYGHTLSSTSKFNTLALEGTLGLPIPPISGFTFGANALFDFAYAQDSGGNYFAVPGNIYWGLYTQYSQSILPLLDIFAQGGYLFKAWNAQDAINTEIHNSNPGANIDLTALDKSGLYLRVGAGLGF